MRHNILFLGLSILIIVLGCKKSPEIATEYIPIFNGIVEANVSITNLSLKVAYSGINIENAKKCGFEISEKEGAKLVEYSVEKPGSTEMIIQFDTVLRESADFKTRAWIVVGTKKFYSNYTFFKGLGFPPPVITSLSKEYAFKGEVFYIYGKYFTDIFPNNQIIVKIDNIQSNVVSATFEKIGVQMPDTKTNGKVKISVNVFGKDAAEKFEIENYMPEIYSVTPQSIISTGEITIKGKFHSEYSNFIYPVQEDKNRYQIVKYADDEIIIKSGEYMNCDSLYYIYFCYPSKNTNVYFNTGYSVKRIGNWQKLNNVPFFQTNLEYIYLGASCDGNGYVIQESGYPGVFLFWKYDPQSDSWTKLPIFPGISRNNPVFFEYHGLLYYGMGNNRSISEIMTDLWKYDPVGKTWTKCADLNLKSTYSYGIFGGVIQDTIMFFSDNNNQKAKYDPVHNTWQISDCEVPYAGANKNMFINEGKYYFQSDSRIFQYNLTTYSFAFQHEYYNYSIAGPVFTIGNRVFTYGGCRVGEIDLINKRAFIVDGLSNYLSQGSSWSINLFAINDVPYFFTEPNKLCKMVLDK